MIRAAIGALSGDRMGLMLHGCKRRSCQAVGKLEIFIKMRNKKEIWVRLYFGVGRCLDLGPRRDMCGIDVGYEGSPSNRSCPVQPLHQHFLMNYPLRVKAAATFPSITPARPFIFCGSLNVPAENLHKKSPWAFWKSKKTLQFIQSWCRERTRYHAHGLTARLDSQTYCAWIPVKVTSCPLMVDSNGTDPSPFY